MLTIFSICRESLGYREKNAFESWRNLGEDVEIIIFGDAKCLSEFCKARRIIHIKEVKRNEFGTPLVNDFFLKAQELAKNNFVCFVNYEIYT